MQNHDALQRWQAKNQKAEYDKYYARASRGRANQERKYKEHSKDYDDLDAKARALMKQREDYDKGVEQKKKQRAKDIKKQAERERRNDEHVAKIKKVGGAIKKKAHAVKNTAGRVAKRINQGVRDASNATAFSNEGWTITREKAKATLRFLGTRFLRRRKRRLGIKLHTMREGRDSK